MKGTSNIVGEVRKEKGSIAINMLQISAYVRIYHYLCNWINIQHGSGLGEFHCCGQIILQGCKTQCQTTRGFFMPILHSAKSFIGGVVLETILATSVEVSAVSGQAHSTLFF